MDFVPQNPKERKRAVIRIGITAFVFLVLPFSALYWTTYTPGSSWSKPIPKLSAEGQERSARMQATVHTLANDIGVRHVSQKKSLQRAETFLLDALRSVGVPKTQLRLHPVKTPSGHVMNNIEVEITGTHAPQEIILLGAHYDTVSISPGADDNASGVAALLELARAFHLPNTERPERTLRFLFFVNEEEPYFQEDGMGSLAYARQASLKKEQILSAIALDMLGYYRDEPNTQKHRPLFRPFYPDRANFIVFVSDVASRPQLHASLRAFRTQARLPSEGLTAPGQIAQIDRSDHWSFWQHGYRGFVITDTAFWRYGHYHKPTDTPDRLDYTRLTLVTDGLEAMLQGIAQTSVDFD